MSKIYFKCKYCEKTLEATREAMGRKIQCYKCDEKFELTPLDIVDKPQVEEKAVEVKKGPVNKPHVKMKKKSNYVSALAVIVVLIGGIFFYIKNQKNIPLNKITTNDKIEVAKETDVAPSTPHSGFLQEIKDNCYRCHGKVKNGKPNVKGDFNLSEMLAKNSLNLEDSYKWLKVLNEVESKKMPPEDVKEEITDEQRKDWQKKIIADLNQKNMKERLLTSSEIDSDHALLFKYNKRHYNPFETLKLLKRSESRYPTIKSADLMSRTFLESMQYGLTELIKDYTQDPYRAQRGHTLTPGETSIASIRTGVTSSAEKLDGNEKASKHFDFRTWGRQRLYLKGHPRFGVVPGKYRITFTASALNRDLIGKVKAQYEGNRKDIRHIDSLMKSWSDLYYSKARISLINSGNDNKQSRTDGIFHTFEIEDNVEKNYTAEFTMTTATLLDLSFDNGPYNGRKHWLKLGKEKRKDGLDYNFPCVRIKNIRITKLEDIKAKNDYDISLIRDKELNEEILLGKLSKYADSIGSGKSKESINKLYSDLPNELNAREKYATALRLISMSPEYLYINFNGNNLISDSRFISYALLKHKPSEELKELYSEVKSGTKTVSNFAKYLVQQKGFNSFLESFTKNWLKYEVPLDTKKFNPKLQQMKANDETVAHLDYIFKNNRPIKEVFDSEYRVMDQTMASFYRQKAKSSNGFAAYNLKGGVLNQAAFFRSQSDGIDGLPFRRAEWILENVFDRHLGNPPNNIDTDEFVSAQKLKTFKERTEFHSKKSACTGCHIKIDPIAFGVNHLGTLGWTVEKPEEEFVNALNDKVSQADKEIASAFTKHLISYITGRNLTVFDHLIHKEIMKSTTVNKFKSQDILAEIIRYYFLNNNKSS